MKLSGSGLLGGSGGRATFADFRDHRGEAHRANISMY
jgi:hypothetical protein